MSGCSVKSDLNEKMHRIAITMQLLRFNRFCAFFADRFFLKLVCLVFCIERPILGDNPKAHKSCKFWQAALFCNKGMEMIGSFGIYADEPMQS